MGLKIAVVGGASSYTPELFADLVDFRNQFVVDQVVLTDPNKEKLMLIRQVGSQVLATAGLGTKLTTTTNLQEAVAGADFVILQIRVGGLEARIRDENIPMELGLVGNETTGAGGFSCAMRTVPAALQVAREIERLSPRAWLLNLSNPAGIVTEALLKHSSLRTIGFCNIPINTTYALAEVLGVPPENIELRSFGLNHLSWTREVLVDGKEKLQPLIAATRDRKNILYQKGMVEDLMDAQWLRILMMIPSWYVRYYYFTAQVLEQDRGHLTKGNSDKETEDRLRSLYMTEGYGETARNILASKGGAQYYLPVLQVIGSILNDRGDVLVVDVQNRGALPDLPADACVELPVRIRCENVEPLSVGPMPLAVRGLVQVVKAYEELAVQAAATGSLEAALTSLAIHPLVGSYSKAQEYWERMLKNDRPFMHPALGRS